MSALGAVAPGGRCTNWPRLTPALPRCAKVAPSRPRGGGSRPSRVAGSEPEAEQQCVRGGERMRVPARGGGNVSAPRGARPPEAASNCLRVKVTGQKSSQHRAPQRQFFYSADYPRHCRAPSPLSLDRTRTRRRVRAHLVLFARLRRDAPSPLSLDRTPRSCVRGGRLAVLIC